MSYSNNISEHKFLTHILSPKKSIMRDIDVPPRKLLSRGARPAPLDGGSPRFSSVDEAMLQRFLPCNGGDDDDVDPYASDHFRMFEFKVRRCTRSRSHDWTDCPFAHPGEKARRRDPRRYHYSGAVCAEYRRGGCLRGDSCEFAHGVFECWLHPARYRTEACKDGRSCKRKVCFFAHTARELRVLPLHSPGTSPAAAGKFRNGQNHCCLYCCHSATNSSPTSTLLGMSHLSSPPHSPPLSPIKHRSLSGLSPFSRFLNSEHSTAGVNLGPQLYKEALNELISSLEAVKFMDAATSSPVGENYKNAPWIDGFEDHHQQPQFVLSPSTSNLSNIASPSGSGSADLYHDVIKNEINGWSCDPDPDLGWVNDLLM